MVMWYLKGMNQFIFQIRTTCLKVISVVSKEENEHNIIFFSVTFTTI